MFHVKQYDFKNKIKYNLNSEYNNNNVSHETLLLDLISIFKKKVYNINYVS